MQAFMHIHLTHNNALVLSEALAQFTENSQDVDADTAIAIAWKVNLATELMDLCDRALRAALKFL